MREIGEETHGCTKETKDQHLMRTLYRRACQGDDRAASLYLGYRWGRPVEQSVNLNENTNTSRMDLDDADRLLNEYHERLGLKQPAFDVAGKPLPDLETARKRVEELLKRTKRVIVEKPITPGSEAVQ